MISSRLTSLTFLIGVLATGFPLAGFAASESVIYSFKGGTEDGSSPNGLLYVDGALYGTTSAGGTGGGIVFKLTPEGTETVLHIFGNGKNGDGSSPPFGSLVKVGKRLYGTTWGGGAFGNGTIFSVTLTGHEKVVYSFKGGTDGANPSGALVVVDGALYGTTSDFGSGPQSDGTLFKVTTAGTETTLYTFHLGADGANPVTTLLNIGGTLYGTTAHGGVPNPGCFEKWGCGTVFKFSRTGVETVLHRFGGGVHGYEPTAGVIMAGHTLYGTTYYGGSPVFRSTCGKYGCGTIFEVSEDGVGKVIYAFKGGSDSGNPWAGLLMVGDAFYGTASGSFGGNGTVFRVTKMGVETVVYGFKAGPDGANPSAGLINVGGLLYGTTSGGGTSGFGTVFKLIP